MLFMYRLFQNPSYTAHMQFEFHKPSQPGNIMLLGHIRGQGQTTDMIV